MEIAFALLAIFALLVGVSLPVETMTQRITNAVYGLSILGFAYFIAPYQQKMDRMAKIEKVAIKMIQEREKSYTSLGFVHAALVFFEKNRDLYPDSYKRAVKMCVQYQCDTPRNQLNDMHSLSLAMEGMLTGAISINE